MKVLQKIAEATGVVLFGAIGLAVALFALVPIFGLIILSDIYPVLEVPVFVGMGVLSVYFVWRHLFPRPLIEVNKAKSPKHVSRKTSSRHDDIVLLQSAVDKHDVLIKKAANGDSASQFEYSEFILTGFGVERDEKIAAGWLFEAAKNKDSRACRKLANCFRSGDLGFPVDRDRASEYLQNAIALGNLEAPADLSRWAIEDAARENAARLAISAIEKKSIEKECSKFLDKCDSEPERLLLEALIAAGKLKPCGEVLKGDFTLELQAKVLKYRADFMLDDKLAVEVDGRAYHSNSRNFETDKYRDQDFLENGYVTVRFPAVQVYRRRDEVVEKILAIRSKLSADRNGVQE